MRLGRTCSIIETDKATGDKDPYIRDGPTGDVAALLDHLVGAGEDGRGQRYAKVAGDSHVDGQLEAGRLFYRQIGGLGAAGDRVDVVNPAVSRAGENDAVLDDSLLA